MKSPTFDSDGYPTDETCDAIRDWPYEDFRGLFEFIRAAWNDCGKVVVTGGEYKFITGGWSGNESLIGALNTHLLANAVCWQSSKRGGLHVYQIPEYQLAAPASKEGG